MPSRPPDTDPAHPWTEKVLPTQLEAIRDAEGDVMARLEEFGYDEDLQFAIRLAFEEALVNAIKHGNRMDPARKVSLAYRVSPECIEIRIRDEGEGFNPHIVPDPTVDENLQRPCGRGIMLMRSYMDTVQYACRGKEVQMIKYRRPSQGGGQAMKIQVREEGGCHVIAICGSADVESSAVLREAILGAIESGAKCIICDLGRTDFICSDALGVLITAYLKARMRGGFVRLVDPQQHVKDVLATMRLDHLFDVYADVQAAIGGSKGKGKGA